MKYWAYINNEILGPYEKEKLFDLPVFSAATLICPQTPVGEKTQDWKEASTYPEVAALLNAHGAPGVPMPAAGEAPVELLKPEAGAAPSHLPKPDAVGPESKLERPAPVFNTEMPESKLKPLSLHTIDQATPAAAPQIEVSGSGVSPQGAPKALPTPDPLKSAPSFTSPNFDPMTISQIGKRVGAQLSEAAPTGEAMSTLSQIDKRAGAQQPQAAASPTGSAPFTLAPVPVFEAPALAPAPAPEPQPTAAPAQGAPADNGSLAELNSRLDAMARAALNKQDIEPLREKLEQLGEVISSMKNGQFQREIMDKIQHLENSISDIKASLSLMSSAAPARAAQSPQVVSIESNAASMMASQPGKVMPAKTPEPAKPPEAEKQEITDQGSSGKTSKIAEVIKKIGKLLITIVLLVGVLGVAAYFLKQFGVFDVSKFLPFQIPYLSSPQPEPEIAAPQPFPDSVEVQAVNTETGQPGETQQTPAEPPKKDLSPEIIYIGRTYAVKPGGDTLENMIYADAAARKGNSDKTTWQVKDLSGNMFELDGVIPLKGAAGQLVYRYEVDYEKKTVKPLDGMSKKPMDALLKGRATAQPDRPKAIKGRKGAAAKQPGPANKPAKAKAAAPAEEEYEYVYEEEAGGTEE